MTDIFDLFNEIDTTPSASKLVNENIVVPQKRLLKPEDERSKTGFVGLVNQSFCKKRRNLLHEQYLTDSLYEPLVPPINSVT